MELPQEKYYTVEDYYNMPDDIRAELIEGEIVYMVSPSRIHQEILGELFNIIKNYIKSQDGRCHVYPAPFGVQLDENEDTVLEAAVSGRPIGSLRLPPRPTRKMITSQS